MSRRHRRTLGALALAAALPLAVAGCGKATDNNVATGDPTGAGSTHSGTTTPGSASTAASPTSTAPATTGTAPTSGGSSTGALPAVTNATNLKVEPVIAPGSGTPPTKLLTDDLVTGTGTQPSASDTVTVKYVGTIFQTGKVFDASWTDGSPNGATFSLANVVPGFAQAIEGMKIGGRREVVIPPSLGYGSTANGPIPANSTLVFVIDLLGVQPGT